MSAIASFYIVPTERLPEILAAATPQPGGWFRTPRDNFREVVNSAGRALETFGWSGWVFNTLDLYFESRRGFMIQKFGDAAATELLAKARGSHWVVLPSAGARDLLAAIEAAPVEPADLTAFVVEEHGPDGADEETVAVQSALTMLKSWLHEVAPGTVGLHSVG